MALWGHRLGETTVGLVLGSESALLKAGVHPGNKLLALSGHRQRQGASSLGWQPGQLPLQEQVACTSQRLSLQSKLCTLISPCSDQGTLRAPKGRRCSHLALQHCEGPPLWKPSVLFTCSTLTKRDGLLCPCDCPRPALRAA